MKLGWKIAKRFLRSNIGQTLLIIVGIGIGVSVQIFIGILIQGLQSSLINKTIGNSSQVTIQSKENLWPIPSDEVADIMSLLKKDQRFEEAGTVWDYTTIVKEEATSYPVLVRSLDASIQNRLYRIGDKIVEESQKSSDTGILMGVGFRDKYGYALGDTVKLLDQSGKTMEFTVDGFFDLQVSGINESWVILNSEQMMRLTGNDSKQVTSIQTRLSESQVFEADVIGKSLSDKITNSDLEVVNWKDENSQLLSGLQGQSVSSLMIQIFVLVSVVLGIASVLAISVMQKSKQIGILKAMGMTNRSTGYVFLFQGLLLGLFGAILGIALGVGLLASFTYFVKNPDGSALIPLQINAGFILASGGIAVLASSVASMIPASKSKKLNPIDIIKNN